MTPDARPVSRRPFEGVSRIVRFNWPFYAIAGAVATIAPVLATRIVAAGSPVGVLLYPALGLVWFWLVGSLAASWTVYDRSPLMRSNWIAEALGFIPRTWVAIHAGFDEMTAVVRAHFPAAGGRAFDIFDPIEMTEPSITRARRLAPAEGAEQIDFRHLPLPSGSVDAVMLLLSAHELRRDGARAALFAEIRRVLQPAGRVIVAEHLRDWANLAAFGPGAFHFHSRRTWLHTFRRARLVVDEERSITPLVRVFVLRRAS